MQLALDPEYPRLRLFGRRPRRAAIQRRPPRLPVGRCKPAVSLRHVPGFPRLGLLRRLRPRRAASADAGPCLPRGARRPPGGFPRSLSFGRWERCPALPLRACRGGNAVPAAVPERRANWRRRDRVPGKYRFPSARLTGPYPSGLSRRSSLKGVLPLVHLRCTYPPRLPRPRRPTVPARRVVVRAASRPHPRLRGRAALSFNKPLRRSAAGTCTPPDPTAPRGAPWRPATGRGSRPRAGDSGTPRPARPAARKRG